MTRRDPHDVMARVSQRGEPPELFSVPPAAAAAPAAVTAAADEAAGEPPASDPFEIFRGTRDVAERVRAALDAYDGVGREPDTRLVIRHGQEEGEEDFAALFIDYGGDVERLAKSQAFADGFAAGIQEAIERRMLLCAVCHAELAAVDEAEAAEEEIPFPPRPQPIEAEPPELVYVKVDDEGHEVRTEGGEDGNA